MIIMISLIICAIALIVVSFGGGWGAKGWKDSAEVALANSQKRDLESSE